MDIFNFEYFYMNMKFYISTLKMFHLNFKYSFDLNLKFQFQIIILDSQKLILPVWKLLNESKNGHFNVEYCYLNLKIDIWILEIVI
jgi:hypothetical protein